jgi:hypothetical protein
MLLKYLVKYRHAFSIFALFASIFFVLGIPVKTFAWIDSLGVDETLINERTPFLIFENETTITDTATGAFYRSFPPGYRLSDGDDSAFIYYLVNTQQVPNDAPVASPINQALVCPGVILVDEKSKNLYLLDTTLEGGRCTLGDNRLYADWNVDVGDRDPVTSLNTDANQRVSIANLTPGPGVNVASGGTTGEAGAGDDTCESAGGVLGWIMCPVSDIMDGVVGWLDSTIQGLLVVNQDRYGSDGLFEAWKQVRNIAYIILIPIMLVMVIGTALGFEIFSAYTVKRALPRMVIAVIFITLSWYICIFLIQFINVVGAGVLGIITTPFTRQEDAQISLSLRGALEQADIVQSGGSAVDSVSSGIGLAGIVAAGTFAAFASGLVTLGIIISTLFSAAIVLFFVFLLLIARQMLIILLLLAAPLAILAWIFPGNDKMWKLWWSSFSKLLLMFPLIMAILGVGRVFAFVVAESAGGDNENRIVTMLLIVAAYIIPFAAIPFTFKWVGGIFGTLSGMVNDKERGFLDKRKKARAETRARTRELAGQNRRFNPSGRLARFNGAAGWLADPKNSAKIKMGTTGGRALASELTQKSAAQSQDLAKWMSGAGFNQEAATAVMTAFQEDGGKLTDAGLKRQVAALRAKGGTQNLAAANVLENSGAFLLNTYQSEEYGRANIGMAAGYVKASQGFMGSSDPAELAKYANFLNSTAPGMGDTFKAQAALMSGQGGGFGKVGYSEQVDAATGEYVEGGIAARSTQIVRASVRDFTGGKAGQLDARFLADRDTEYEYQIQTGTGPDGKPVFGEIQRSNAGTVRHILRQDTSAGEVVLKDKTDTTKIDVQKQKALIDNLTQAAYGYDTPAETAAKLRAEIDRIKSDSTISVELQTHLRNAESKATRAPIDPASVDFRAPPPPPEDGR